MKWTTITGIAASSSLCGHCWILTCTYFTNLHLLYFSRESVWSLVASAVYVCIRPYIIETEISGNTISLVRCDGPSFLFCSVLFAFLFKDAGHEISKLVSWPSDRWIPVIWKTYELEKNWVGGMTPPISDFLWSCSNRDRVELMKAERNGSAEQSGEARNRPTGIVKSLWQRSKRKTTEQRQSFQQTVLKQLTSPCKRQI